MLFPLSSFIAPRMTISYLEGKGGQKSFQELLMEKGGGSLNPVKFGSHGSPFLSF